MRRRDRRATFSPIQCPSCRRFANALNLANAETGRTSAWQYCRVRDMDSPPERARPRAQQGANLKNAWFIRESQICERCCGRGRPRSCSVVHPAVLSVNAAPQRTRRHLCFFLTRSRVETSRVGDRRSDDITRRRADIGPHTAAQWWRRKKVRGRVAARLGRAAP